MFWLVSLFFCWGDYRLGRRDKSLPAWLFFLTGWITQFILLYMRGIQMGRCPIGTLAEILTFMSWATGAIYLVLNLVYRSNALALFTIGAMTAVQTLTVFLPRSSPRLEEWLNSSWLGLHASLSVLAYGAFIISSVLALMFLWKERQIKEHDLSTGAMTFPAVTTLELWMTRIVFAGFVLYSGGLLAGFFWFENLPADQRRYDYKICWAASVWIAFLALILAHRFHWLRHRLAAWLYVALTGATLLSFWIINSFSTYHRF